jgi:hypothetical protein
MRLLTQPLLYICIFVYLFINQAHGQVTQPPQAEAEPLFEAANNETILEGLIEIWEADNFQTNSGRLWVTLTSSPKVTHHLVFPSEDQIDNLRSGQLLRVAGKRMHAHEVGWMLSESHIPVEVTHHALVR